MATKLQTRYQAGVAWIAENDDPTITDVAIIENMIDARREAARDGNGDLMTDLIDAAADLKFGPRAWLQRKNEQHLVNETR